MVLDSVSLETLGEIEKYLPSTKTLEIGFLCLGNLLLHYSTREFV